MFELFQTPWSYVLTNQKYIVGVPDEITLRFMLCSLENFTAAMTSSLDVAYIVTPGVCASLVFNTRVDASRQPSSPDQNVTTTNYKK